MAATTTEGKIREALLAKTKALVLSPAHPVAWPDLPFTRPGSGGWIEVDIFEVPTVPVAVANNGTNEHSGLFQITVCERAGSGVMLASDVAGQVVNHFARGTQFANGGLQIRINSRPEIANTYRDDDITRTPVTVRYQVFASQ
jgi:hypothetical protein